jgi:hypothetical protein
MYIILNDYILFVCTVNGIWWYEAEPDGFYGNLFVPTLH